MRGEFEGDGEPDIGERPGTDNRGSGRVGTDDAGGARAAVARRLQLAQQIVMLERRRRQEDGVDREPDERQPLPLEVRESSS